jgi:SNF2 family DNA or RNA helicase
LVHRQQSEDRAHRSGQTNKVTYIDIIMEKSVDGTVLGALSNKMNVSEFVTTSIRQFGQQALTSIIAGDIIITDNRG